MAGDVKNDGIIMDKGKFYGTKVAAYARRLKVRRALETMKSVEKAER